ncbi:unnamed protein product [Trichobilharzia regenti]|nr:unnamed protein product [Trichobilharzia regenti]
MIIYVTRNIRFNPISLLHHKNRFKNKSTVDDRLMGESCLGDIQPMSIDSSVGFQQIGGHEQHILALRESIILPLMYPEVFSKFNVDPPRGVLFSGPPGTGKTLLARALANECSRKRRAIAFFMRKGADCLSKWVGESERQLRLLFDQAYRMRPSVIFFDEIDGLAPVRSSKQDQIHSSIVSTLLSLMDGLDNRAEVVVIGATNRPDAIDPALRRPGRFDREFIFTLPSEAVRRQILGVITSKWDSKPDSLVSLSSVVTILVEDAFLVDITRIKEMTAQYTFVLNVSVTDVRKISGVFHVTSKFINKVYCSLFTHRKVVSAANTA